MNPLMMLPRLQKISFKKTVLQISARKSLSSMSEFEKNRLADSALSISKWFEVDLTIKVFGKVIWSYHYPPKNS